MNDDIGQLLGGLQMLRDERSPASVGANLVDAIVAEAAGQARDVAVGKVRDAILERIAPAFQQGLSRLGLIDTAASIVVSIAVVRAEIRQAHEYLEQASVLGKHADRLSSDVLLMIRDTHVDLTEAAEEAERLSEMERELRDRLSVQRREFEALKREMDSLERGAAP